MNGSLALFFEPPLIFLAFPLMWLAVCGLLSMLGGWFELASDYRASGTSNGARIYTSGSVGWRYFPVSYNNCLIATVDQDGLRLSILFPFRFMHPPLYFPWKAVESLEVRSIFFTTGTVLHVRGFGRRITVYGKAAAAVCLAFDKWRAGQSGRSGTAIATSRRSSGASAHPVVVGLCYAVFAFAFFSIAINSSPKGWAYWYQLSQYGRTTTATITRIDVRNHRACRFTYQVGGRTFGGAEPCSPNIGAQVTVTYLPNNPGVATLDSARGQFYFTIFAPFLMACFAGIVTAWRMRSSAKAMAAVSRP